MHWVSTARLCKTPLRRDSGTGSQAWGRAAQSPPQLGTRRCRGMDAHLQGSTPSAATGGGPKARSEAPFTTPSEGVGRAVTALLAKPRGIPTRSSGFVTYRLRNPAARAAAPQPSRAAAAILLRVRRRGTGLSFHRAAPRAGAGAGAARPRTGQAPWRAPSTGRRRRCCE